MERTPKEESDSRWDELSAPQPESYGDEQDVADVQTVRQIAKSYFEKRRAMAPERAKKEAHNLIDIQQGFIGQCKRDKERGRETSKEEFLKWEQDYAYTWDRLNEYVNDGGLSTSEQAEIEAPVFFTDEKTRLMETVEVQAAKYFEERSQELRAAIMASDEKTKDTDLRILGSFFRSVMDHVSYRYMTPDDIREQYGNDVAAMQSFDRARTAAHNAVIKHLNELNRLARKYGTTPFTPRDFWTSESSSHDPAVARRMKCDRNTVEAYYTVAFSDDLEADRRRRERMRFH